MDYIELLKNEPVFWTPHMRAFDPPIYDGDKPAIIYDNDTFALKTYHEFIRAGVKIFTSNLSAGWMGVNIFDYSITDYTLDTLLKDYPDIYYLPRIKLNVPIDWCYRYPEEVFVYYNGPKCAEEIRKLVNTPEHDWFGFNGEGGADNADVFVNSKMLRRNMDGKICLQSFSSKQWIKDATDALRRVIRHIEDGPFGKQIIGYHIAYGCCGETVLWGSWDPTDFNRRGDYGIAAKKAFFNFGMEKYGDLNILRKKWNKADLNSENCEPPLPALRETGNRTLQEFFRANENGQMLMDYNEFSSSVNAGALEHFGKVVKEETNCKLVGIFHGYMVSQQVAYSGQLNIDQLLNSPYIDFFAAPKGYHRCECGQPGGFQGPAQSVSRKKLWMDEIDNHTYLSKKSPAKDFFETRTLYWRETVKNLTCNLQYWYMDLGGGWFDDEKIMREIHNLYNFAKSVRLKRHRSISEVLYVVDDVSLKKMPVCYGLVTRLIRGDIPCELRLTGVPIDVYRLNDLEDMDLTQYKLIVFANTFSFRAGQWEKINRRIPKEVTLLWFYAAGIRNPEYSVENIKLVTGFSVTENVAENPEPFTGYNLPDDFPQLSIIAEDKMEILKKYQNGEIKMGKKILQDGKISMLCTYPDITAIEFREIIIQAGCRLIAPTGCTVYADNRVIGLFPQYDISGEIELPDRMTAYEYISKTLFDKKIEYSLPKNGVAVYMLEEKT